jgi:hypothetical protein
VPGSPNGSPPFVAAYTWGINRGRDGARHSPSHLFVTPTYPRWLDSAWRRPFASATNLGRGRMYTETIATKSATATDGLANATAVSIAPTIGASP